MASPTEASPADIRNGLDPVEVDALAMQLHSLSCVVLGAPGALSSPDHAIFDRTRARFILLGLREWGWSLTKAGR